MSTSVDWMRARVAVERERRRREADAVDHDGEFARCRADVAYFVDTYLVIDDAQGHGDGSGTMPFRLWPDQRTALGVLAAERLVIFLKARQLGISWLCLAYALWLMLFHPGKMVLLFSQGETEAVEMLRRARAMYERLPAWMIARLPTRVRSNTSEQGWANGSSCRSMPATEKAGRSFTASLAVLDEAAHQQYGGRLYAALKPTIDAGGKLFVVSSANGADGFFDRLWKKASAGLSNFRPVFLPWWSRPGRDQSWYASQVADAADPELVRQEYPNDPIEAFVASGRVRFPNSWVAAQSANVRAPIEPASLPDALRSVVGLRVYEAPEPRPDSAPATRRGRPARFLLAADVAEGLERGDFSAAVLTDADAGEELACLHGRWEPDEFAAKLAAVADAYDAYILVERNNHGHAVLSKLRTLCPWRILLGPDGREGWLTGVLTKPVAVDALAVGLRDRSLTVRTAAALAEFEVYSVLPNGKTSAPPGDHDDLVMAWAIGLGWRQMVGWPEPGAAFVGGKDRHILPSPGGPRRDRTPTPPRPQTPIPPPPSRWPQVGHLKPPGAA